MYFDIQEQVLAGYLQPYTVGSRIIGNVPELPMDGYRTGATPEAGRPGWEAGLAADWLEWAVLGVLWGEVLKAVPAIRRMAASSACSST